MKETDLYNPIKVFFEAKGYEVKAEVTDCDVVALKKDEEPIIIELKKSLSFDFLIQGIDRQGISDNVYLAFPHGNGNIFKKRIKGAVKLCKRLGLGLISVRLHEQMIIVHCDPEEYRPRKVKKRKIGLLNEFYNRLGDPNVGGQSGKKIITAYRQDVLRILKYIELNGAISPKDIIKDLNIKKAPSILQLNYYGWFERVDRGVYSISVLGKKAVNDNANYLKEL